MQEGGGGGGPQANNPRAPPAEAPHVPLGPALEQAPRPTSSTSSTCQDAWCRKLTGAARTSTLWWSVERRMNGPTPLIPSLIW